MVIYILYIIEHTLVDAEEVLRLAGMGNDPLREADMAILLAELTGENLSHIGADDRAVQNALDAAGNNIEFHSYPGVDVFSAQGSLGKLFKKIRNALVVGQLFAQFPQVLIAHAVQTQRIHTHVRNASAL